MPYDRWRAEALTTLASQLTGEVLREGLQVAQAISDENLRAETLITLAPHLTGQWLRESLTMAHAITSTEIRGPVLAALVPRLADEASTQVLRQELAAAQIIGDDELRALALTILVSQLGGELLREALAAARGMKNDWGRALALAALAPHLPNGVASQVLREGLAAAREVGNNWDRAQVLATLAPQLTGELLQEGLAVAGTLTNDSGSLVLALTALGSRLTGEARGEVLMQALFFARLPAADRIRILAPSLLRLQSAGMGLRQGLAATLPMNREWPRAQALAALAAQLTGEPREQAIREGLAAVPSPNSHRYPGLDVTNNWDRTLAMTHPRYQFETYKNNRDRALAMAALAQHLTGGARDQALREGLEATRVIIIDDPLGWSEVLVALAPQLTGELAQVGLEVAQAIKNERFRAQALAAFLPHLSDPAPYLRTIRNTTANCLRSNLADRKREDVLEFITDTLFLRKIDGGPNGPWHLDN